MQAEIDKAMRCSDGESSLPDYMVIQTLPYLDMVVNETLRLHTSLGVISRGCVKDTWLDSGSKGSVLVRP